MKTEVYTSTDGIMWNLQGTVGERLDQIYWNGKRYLMTYGDIRTMAPWVLGINSFIFRVINEMLS